MDRETFYSKSKIEEKDILAYMNRLISVAVDDVDAIRLSSYRGTLTVFFKESSVPTASFNLLDDRLGFELIAEVILELYKQLPPEGMCLLDRTMTEIIIAEDKEVNFEPLISIDGDDDCDD